MDTKSYLRCLEYIISGLVLPHWGIISVLLLCLIVHDFSPVCQGTVAIKHGNAALHNFSDASTELQIRVGRAFLYLLPGENCQYFYLQTSTCSLFLNLWEDLLVGNTTFKLWVLSPIERVNCLNRSWFCFRILVVFICGLKFMSKICWQAVHLFISIERCQVKCSLDSELWIEMHPQPAHDIYS